MNNPFLISRKSKVIYCAVWSVLASIQTFLVYFSAGQDILPALIDSFVSNGLYSVCILTLWHSVGNYKDIRNIPLLLVFHFLLQGLCLLTSIGGTAFLLASFFPSELYELFFIDVLPLRIWIGTFIYSIAILSYYQMQAVHQIKKQMEEIANLKNETDNIPEEKLNRIAVKKNKEIHFIPVQDILYVEANGDYVLIYTSTGRFLKDKTMKYLETHLPSNQFVRIHRSFIINIEYLVKLELYEKELYQVQLKGGAVLKVSNAGYKLLKQQLQ
jgi:hypothetical protein